MSHPEASIPDLLKSTRTIAVVGLSNKPHRDSNEVAAYLQRNGFRIVAVNPSYAGTRIHGEFCYGSLTEAASALAQQNIRIDIVNCFRNSDAIEPIADEAIAIGVRCLWMQLGVVNHAAAEKAKAAGLKVVMDRCIKIEHMHAAD